MSGCVRRRGLCSRIPHERETVVREKGRIRLGREQYDSSFDFFVHSRVKLEEPSVPCHASAHEHGRVFWTWHKNYITVPIPFYVSCPLYSSRFFGQTDRYNRTVVVAVF